MRFPMLLVLSLVPLAALGAEPNPEIAAIQTQLVLIQQQENALFQEFQMLQELRRLTLQSDIQTISYDDRVQAEQRRDQRVSDLAAELRDRYGAYRQLEEEKTPLIARLRELSAQP